MGQAAGSPCGVTAIGMGRGHVDVDGVDMLDDRLSGYELPDRLVAAAIPGGRNQSVGHGRHFIPDVIGGGRVFDPHAVSQFQQPVHQIVGPKEHLDPALRRPFLDETVLRSVGEQEHRYDEDLEAQDAVYGILDGDGGVPGLGERAGERAPSRLTVWRSGRSCPRITGRP